MKDRLARACPVVHDHPEGLAVTRIDRDAPCDGEEVPRERLVLQLGEPRDMRARDHEHVKWRRGGQIAEGDRLRILMDDRRGKLARRDTAEHAVAHGW